MKHTKIVVCLLALFFIAQAALWSEQLTKIAVVDVIKIYKAFFKESKAVRDLEEYKKKYEAELAKKDDQIDELEKQIQDAKKQGNQDEVLKLQAKKEDLRRDRNDYYRLHYREYVKQFDVIKKSQSQDLWLELIGIIEYIALKESYSVVLRIDDPYVIFYTKDVDITNKVLEEINRRHRNRR